MKKLISEIPYIKSEDIELKKLTLDDTSALKELTENEEVYKFLPSFLFEKKYESAEDVINRLYDECLEESLILGVFSNGEFCGLAEIYGYSAPLLKVSIGCRLLPCFWGKGIATKTVNLIVDFLFNETEVKVITASVMPENSGSANVLKKNGFRRVLRSVPGDWGFSKPVFADKWAKTAEPVMEKRND